MLPGLQAIGVTCQQTRKAKGWTQAAAASQAGVNRSVISQIETGQYSGSLKALTLYLTALELQLTVHPLGLPQWDQLETLFNDD